MRHNIQALTMAILAGFNVWAFAQASDPAGPSEQARPLAVTQTVEMPSELKSMMAGGMKCDSDGNVYYRPYDEQKQMKGGIRKVDSKGKTQAIFRLDSDPDFATGRGGMTDFSISKDGDFYGLAWRAQGRVGGYYVVQFAKSGEVKSKIKLDKTLAADLVVGVSGGNFLIAGLEAGTPEHPAPTRPFTAIVDAKGKMVKRIVAPDDQRIGDAADAGDNEYVLAPGHGNHAVTGGSLMMGSDGNAYLLRSVTGPIITVISPGGEIVRSFTVKPPASNMRFIEAQIAENRIALFWWDSDSHKAMIRVVDYEGQIMGTYESTTVGPAFVCFSPKEGTFTFLTTKNGHQALLQAQ